MSDAGPPVHVVLLTWLGRFLLLVALLGGGLWLATRRVRPGARLWVGGVLLGAGAASGLLGAVLMGVDAWGGQNEEVAFVLFALALVCLGGGLALRRPAGRA